MNREPKTERSWSQKQTKENMSCRSVLWHDLSQRAYVRASVTSSGMHCARVKCTCRFRCLPQLGEVCDKAEKTKLRTLLASPDIHVGHFWPTDESRCGQHCPSPLQYSRSRDSRPSCFTDSLSCSQCRQADMVQTLINEVRRLGTEKHTNLQDIQRLRAEQFLPIASGANGCSRTTTTSTSCRTRNHRHENWEETA